MKEDNHAAGLTAEEIQSYMKSMTEMYLQHDYREMYKFYKTVLDGKLKEYAALSHAPKTPTDEEIEKEAVRLFGHNSATEYYQGWVCGAKWMRDQLSLPQERNETSGLKGSRADEIAAVVLACRDELLKHLFPVTHTNGYHSKAVPQATILELPSLMKSWQPQENSQVSEREKGGENG